MSNSHRRRIVALERRLALPESDPTPTTNPQDQDYWPQDSLHDAARQVVGGMKGLVPNARRTLREAAERADAAPVGRAASDAAIRSCAADRTVSNPSIKNLTVAHINTQYRNTAFPVTGVFEMLPAWAIQSGDDRAAPKPANAAFYTPPQVCLFKFWHPGYLVTGGHTVTVTVMGVAAKSNTFAVL